MSAWFGIGEYLAKTTILGRLLDKGYRYIIHPAESTAGLTTADLTFGFDPGDLRRYGADPTGAADSTAAIANAFKCALTVFGGGAQCSYKTSSSIGLKNYTDFDGEGCTIHVTADVPAITNATGAGVVYARVRNVALVSDVVAASAAMDLVDVSRSSFQRILIDRGVAAKSWGYAIRGRAVNSVCLWNRFLDIEAAAVNTGFISLETANVNQNVFLSCKLINDPSLPIAHGVKFVSAGDNAFFDLDLEANFSGSAKNYGVDFDTGTNNGIHKLRTEGYNGSASFYGVNYGGTDGANFVTDHYQTGYGVAGPPFDGFVAGNTYIGSGYVLPAAGTLAAVKGEVGWDSVSDRFKGTTNAGGQRLIPQSPALDDLDMNGQNVANIRQQSAGWGTPTNAAVINDYNGASATLAQTSNAVAAIIEALQQVGLFRA